MAAQNLSGNAISSYSQWVSGPHIAIPPHRPQALIKWISTDARLATPSNEIHFQEILHPVFHLFPGLPTELRLKIWSYAAPEERVVELRSWGDSRKYPFQPVKFSAGPHRPPSILHVNQESRQEALRHYRLVDIGVSVAPQWPGAFLNPSAASRRPRYLSDTTPYPPQRIYLDFSRDIIYLGPEFRLRHLQAFLSSTGSGFELPGLQHVALERKLWFGCASPRPWETLRLSLYALRTRPLKNVFIVPDDITRYSLEDRFYNRRHEIRLLPPEWTYTFRPGGIEGPTAKNAPQNCEEWFDRLWTEQGLKGPNVQMRSVRRNGEKMSSYRDGVWDVQKQLGDMAAWSSWAPPQEMN